MYYPNYQQPAFNGYMQQNRAQEPIQYVNGIESAKAYNMPPNSSAILMDAQADRFYLKSTDASGFSSVKVYDFVEHKEPAPMAAQDYVTRAEYEDLRAQLINISKALEKGSQAKIKGSKEVNNE